ncbi:TetR/AcrR family transcriptional regulator [Corynebacterium sp. H128]|uniref:TetR/AcrR family transcriptional regulator n=1 Tax=unclassified Corynebacterium TaxID=2624378 RepID=UPI0030B0912F
MSRPERTRMNPEQRKALILETASAAFAVDSFQDVSVAQIARDTGVSVALVHKYFASKNGLFAAVLAESFRLLRSRQNAYLQGKESKRDKVVALLEAYLDHVAELRRPHEVGYFLHGHDERESNEVRRLYEQSFVVTLRAIIEPNASAHDFYAVQSFPGFVQSAAVSWVLRGCQPEEKHPVVEVLIGGLEGALGDWKR